MIDEKRLDDLAAALIRAATDAGAEAADAVASTGESLGVTARGRALEEAERQETVDFGLRVLISGSEDGRAGFRQASVSASDPDPAVIKTLAERAVAMAREAPLDPYAGLAPPELLIQEIPDLDLIDAEAPPSPEALLETALALEESALGVAGVAQVEGASAGWRVGRIVLAATNGFHGAYDSGSHSISVSAVAGTGVAMERDYAYSAQRKRSDLKSVEEIGRDAGARAVRRLNPKRPKTGAYPVIFEPRIAAGIASALTGALNGAAVARGASFLRDKMGARIAPETFQLHEDPTRPGGLGARPFDGEGLAGRSKRLIADGVVSEWLLDLASARKLGLDSNGSAARSVGGAPNPGAGEVWIAPGAVAPEELLRGVSEGVWIHEMMGAGFNAVTGDYSRAATGFWIENGEIAHPISEFTVAGQVFEMLERMTVANDLTRERRIDSPTLLIDGLRLGAE